MSYHGDPRDLDTFNDHHDETPGGEECEEDFCPFCGVPVNPCCECPALPARAEKEANQ